ncbi:hypothetical protein HPC49_46560 [Pyxidicoccus fallax]|uniref:Uncharacterized protein n=1 Tax=Pyxidicoccus fallax TaxID=394095 RepID=A0A848LWJ2_9BACT|nr:hypothetical protein [Pyxidicoccus fallax]NMO21980.1 hypothetical protein [Pyxidicoccus fallax]NPC85640.1 hypothetical protein [Pyxidicoccus fallax]
MLLESLRDGSFGVKFDVGDGFQREDEAEVYAGLERTADDTTWHLAFTPFRLGLRPEDDAVLRDDFERQVRFLFQRQYDMLPSVMGGTPRLPPRTSDPSWSPLIALERIQVGGAPCLRVLYRLAYEHGLEIVEGLLLIPLASGLFQFKVSHGERFTGYRETALLSDFMRKEPGVPPDELMKRHGQRAYDSPEWDARFPEHSLSRVRAALTWLTTPEQSGLAVLAPMPPPPRGEVELPGVGCAITPPPRYTPVPSEDVGLSSSIAMFVRLLASDNRTLDVWRSPDTLPPGPGRAEALVNLARRNAQEWVQEGATDITMDTHVLPELDGRPHVANHLRFLARGRPVTNATRWLADADGAVFRVAVGGPPYLPIEELAQEADAVIRSWRRLPDASPRASAPPAPAAKKPWWRFW